MSKRTPREIVTRALTWGVIALGWVGAAVLGEAVRTWE